MQTDTQVSNPQATTNVAYTDSTPALSASLTATAPGELKVIKRNGTA